MIVLQLIGPTGVGKSHWGKWLVEAVNDNREQAPLLFYDLDSLLETPSDSAESLFLRYGPHYFWERSMQELECLHKRSDLCVVATGAGTQWVACLLGEYERLLAFPSCSLWCEPEALLRYLQLHRRDQRSLEALKRTEYSIERMQLYGQTFRIDRTSLSEQQLKAALKTIYLLAKAQNFSH